MWIYAFMLFETMDGIKNSEKNKWMYNVFQNKISGMWNLQISIAIKCAFERKVKIIRIGNTT